MAETVSDLADCLRSYGLDLNAATQVQTYNREVTEPHRLDPRRDTHNLALLIGNSAALWDKFVDHLAANPSWMDRADPLDDYVEHAIGVCLENLGIGHGVRFAHRPEPEHISFLTLAHVSGLGYRSAGNLCVHPVYGPWIGLRAVVVMDTPGPPGSSLAPPCDHCQAGCQRKLEEALSTFDSVLPDHAELAKNWRLFLAVRDACPIGREHRYGEQQILYHYTKDRTALTQAVKQHERKAQ